MSLCSSVFGMTQAIHGHFKIAIFCLALSGLCDMFDGKVARSKKDRTDDEKAFGIQIDSLCDVVCFGIFPAMICYLLGVRGPIGLLLIAFYCINSVIRLAYFNVMEAKQALVTESGEKFYKGLPITSMAIVLPLVFMIQFLLPCIIGVIAAILFFMERDNDTFKNLRTIPVTSTQMVLAKIIVLFLFGIVFCVASTIVTILCGFGTLEVYGIGYKLFLQCEPCLFPPLLI